MKKVKTILIGTPEFAEKIFGKFLEAKLPDFEVITVITAPDKPVGRKQILTPPPVKKWALENNLPVLQPDKIRKSEWVEKIKQLNPNLILLAAYGQIIPKKILDMPKYGALNIHPSLLPKYRGASPIQTTILNDDTEAGVTIILMDEEIDHGDIVAKLKVNPPAGGQKLKITYEELSNQLSALGAELLIKTLPDWINGKIKPKPQEHSKATFCKTIRKEDGRINWSKSAIDIERQIRAYREWPKSYAEIKSQKSKVKNCSLKLKILESDISTALATNKKIGEVFLDENKNLCVQTGDGILILKQVQLEGKKSMSAKDFLNGHPEIVGAILK